MTRPGLRKALAEKFDDELKFFKGWIDKPKTVGSIVPTSSITAEMLLSLRMSAALVVMRSAGTSTFCGCDRSLSVLTTTTRSPGHPRR